MTAIAMVCLGNICRSPMAAADALVRRGWPSGGHRARQITAADVTGSTGWRRRAELWQLYPLLVHTVLFGGGYRRQAQSIARRWS